MDPITLDFNSFGEGQKTAVFLIGKMGSGKTSLAALVQAESPDTIMSVFPGQICRKRFGAGFFAECEDSVSPDSTEELVRQVVADALSIQDKKTVVVDGFPRSPEQINWLFDNIITDRTFVFVYVSCDEDVRMERLNNREDGDEQSLIKKRNEQESEKLLSVLENLVCIKTVVKVVNNSGNKPILGKMRYWIDRFKHVVPRTLDQMFHMHQSFNDMVLSRYNITSGFLYHQAKRNERVASPFDLHVVWIRRYANKVIKETEELLAELPDEWWTDDKVDLEKVREELIDVFHFLMSAVHATGMNAAEFYDSYMKKRSINIQRQLKTDGYIKRDYIPIKLTRTKPFIYLGGPILGVTDDTWWGVTWRDLVEDRLGKKAVFLDPLKRRKLDVGPGTDKMRERIDRDLEDIARSDMMIAYLSTGSAGTAMEMFFANRIMNVPVHVITSVDMDALDKISGWVSEHATTIKVISNFNELVAAVSQLIKEWRDEQKDR